MAESDTTKDLKKEPPCEGKIKGDRMAESDTTKDLKKEPPCEDKIKDEDVEMTLMETDKGAGINQVSPDQTPSTDLLPLSREDLRKLMSKQVFRMNKGAYLNRIIKDMGKRSAKLENTSGGIAALVEKFMVALRKQICETDSRFLGNIKPCGSYYEGVKIKQANEFDYIYALEPLSGISQEHLKFTRVIPHTFKPRKEDSVYPRTYYKVEFEPEIPVQWRCGECNGCKNDRLCQCSELKPRIMQTSFQECVRKAVLKLTECQKPFHISMNGPAVTVYTELNPALEKECLSKKGQRVSNKHGNLIIKVDITLAIPLDSQPEQTWPLDTGTDELEINKYQLPENTCPIKRIDRCIMVIYGDYWRLSFSNKETEFINKAVEQDEKKELFQFLKFLRDKLALTHEHESGLLSTYPLKVMFMKTIQDHDSNSEWLFRNMSARVRDILERLEGDGSSGKLTSFFVRNDPVMMESDRSYLEVRRLQGYLQELQQTYEVHGALHTAASVLQFICMIIIFFSSVVYLGKYMHCNSMIYSGLNNSRILPPSSRLCNTTHNGKVMKKQALGVYLFFLLPSTFVGLLIAVACLAMIAVPRLLTKSTNLLYKMYKGVVFVNICLVAAYLIVGGCGIRLGVGYKFMMGYFNTPDVVKAATQMNMFCSFCFLVLFVLHTLLFFLLTKCSMHEYHLEWVFFDKLYAQAFSFCKTASQTHNSSETPASEQQTDDDHAV